MAQTADDLSAPLGQETVRKTRRYRLPFTAIQAVAVLLGLFIVVFVGFVIFNENPLGGEPMTRIALEPALAAQEKPAAAPVAEPATTSDPAKQAAPSTQKTVTIIDGSTGKRQEIAIPASRDVRAPLEQRSLETTRHGAIPRIAPDGARPAEIYARAMKPLEGRKDGPRIAIVIGGLGISANITQQAMQKLPGPVTFAFSPYGAEVERLATSARAAGHEILLQAPMEPFDYPDNDPGPQTLLTTLSGDQNLDRLHWLMSRFQGYVGIANMMGARFTSNEQALGPVLKETARRGLIYVDDGSSPRSVAGQIAGANNMPFAKAELILDAVPASAHIDKALAKLEALAREHGSAVGIASALPASIERITQWAKGAEARGIVLVPITTVAIKPKSS